MELTRFQLAAVKRTAQNVKKLVSTRNKLNARMRALAEEIIRVNKQIDLWETPIKEMTGGYTSEQVLQCNGHLPEVNEAQEEHCPEEFVETNNEE